jgi:hypothetical protein
MMLISAILRRRFHCLGAALFSGSKRKAPLKHTTGGEDFSRALPRLL